MMEPAEKELVYPYLSSVCVLRHGAKTTRHGVKTMNHLDEGERTLDLVRVAAE